MAVSNKFRALVAGGIGAALLAGGTTYALWDAQSTVNAGTITNGDLNIAATSGGWYDISADRTDKAAIPRWAGDQGHAVDLATWRAVPGDTALGLYDIDGLLEGDNMVAQLNVRLADGSPLPTAPTTGMTLQYALVKADGSPLSGTTPTWTNDVANIKFASADNPLKGSLPTLNASIGAAEYRVAVRASFAASTTDRDFVQAKTVLGNLTFDLSQTRASAGGGF